MNEQRVLIVGGGVSGLTAANRLREAGIEAVIIEGRSRLGGRIHTVDVDSTDTSWVDMGAALIDDHRTNKVYKLLEPAGSPFSHGAYSYQTAETRRGDYAMLGQSTHGGRLLFAGDACVDGTYLSSVEGALESGERAAAAISDEPTPPDDHTQEIPE